MQINLKDKSTAELKILAFDLSESVQQYNEVLKAIMEEIRGRKLTEALPNKLPSEENKKAPE